MIAGGPLWVGSELSIDGMASDERFEEDGAEISMRFRWWFAALNSLNSFVVLVKQKDEN